MGIYHDPEQIKAMREAQKRLAWIDNVKRKLGCTQEQAEAAYIRVFLENIRVFVEKKSV